MCVWLALCLMLGNGRGGYNMTRLAVAEAIADSSTVHKTTGPGASEPAVSLRNCAVYGASDACTRSAVGQCLMWMTP